MPANKKIAARPAVQEKRDRRGESGNVFFFIFVGVVLFAALMFTFSRGARQGTTNISDRQADLMASDILAHAQKLERGIVAILRRNYSEADICFDNDAVTGLATASCADPECHVFSELGGTVGWQDPPAGANDGSTWNFNAANTITGIGCDTADAGCTDLIAIVPNLDLNVCLKINDRLQIANPSEMPPVDDDNDFDETTKFTGSFAYGNTLATGGPLDGKSAGCFMESAGVYHFYHVLHGR